MIGEVNKMRAEEQVEAEAEVALGEGITTHKVDS